MCVTCVYLSAEVIDEADDFEDIDEADDILEDEFAYVPAEVVEYEGYSLGTGGIVTIIIIALLGLCTAILFARKAVKEGVYESSADI